MNKRNGTASMIGVGSPVVDMVAQVPETFLTEIDGAKGGMELVDAETLTLLQTILPDATVRTPGGSAGNTAFAMARLGIPSRFLGTVGTDTSGTFCREAFEALGGCGMAFRTHRDLPTALCLSLVTPDGERTMRTHLGAAASLDPSEITPEDFQGYGHAHVEGYLLFNPDLMCGVLRAAKLAGCRISVDLASFEVVLASREILPELLEAYVDIVFANEEEATAFAGANDPVRCLEALHAHCETVAVKQGAQGVLLRCGQETCAVPARPVVAAVDTTGAGDLWAAGFLYGLLKRENLAYCGHLGAALGAAVVTRQGAALPETEWQRLRSEFGIDCGLAN
jgi:sugar/nucleoside kinase (ribokinase family)